MSTPTKSYYVDIAALLANVKPRPHGLLPRCQCENCAKIKLALARQYRA